MPWVSPEAWLKFVVQRGIWPLMAGCNRHDYEGARRNLGEFWKTFQRIHPDFSLFSIPGIDFTRCLPWAIHGDEGRTLKKSGIMITSVQSVLGRGYDEKRVGQSSSARLEVNYTGHSFTTRYILNTMPKSAYDNDPNVFNDMVDHVGIALDRCLRQGFVDPSTGEHYRVAVVGVKGDAPYLAKVGNFYRSYNTTAKRGEERGPPKGVCPYCLAGTRGFEAEEIQTSNPKWLLTVGVKLPWVRCPSLISRLVHDEGDPATFFKSDIWHVVHLGFGRSWVASVLQLCLGYLPCQNLEEKWDFLTNDYLGWCSQNHSQAHISKITPYLMSYHDSGGAMGNWHKGALTTNFMRWIVDFLGRVPADPQGLLIQCRMATYRLNSMFGVLYRGGAFLTENEADFVSTQGLQFLNVYGSLAWAMFMAGRQWLFPLYPKLHIFHHIMLELKSQGRNLKTCCNPMLWACQMDEDLVGKSSRLSRRVNIRKVSERALQRYLTAAYTAHDKAGLLA
jgi:hypothetical protein